MISKKMVIMIIVFLMIGSLRFSPRFSKAQAALPVPREKTVVTEILGSEYWTVFDSANPYIPHGSQWGSGWHQLAWEWDWYINYATGEIIYWRVTGWEFKEPIRKISNGEYVVALSDHADFDDLLSYVEECEPKIVITDNYRVGEAETLAREISRKLKIKAVAMPKKG